MAGLPKKYARMGFKKGWREYRKAKARRGSTARAPKKVKNMARKRTRRYRKKNNKSSGINLGGMAKPLTAIGYGYVRDKVSDMIARSSIGQKLPATNYTDEAAMLGVLYLGGRLGLNKIKYVRSMIDNGKSVEWARIGQTLSDMQQQKSSGSMTAVNAGMQATIF